ncbi:hypothetical protein RHSIM_Rhsim11G0130400 [Rhododendron simsii]|uniref:Uncharacterized protein n=1 Tax=Rhododendron simsii TaxID=118357 RepID=A0A834G8G5_RHOSS|nr:hypothetical protein RHSIM_Rhsim11G0130400 [Rhododendron simsii]
MRNFKSLTTVHEVKRDGQIWTVVLESYVVDVPEGNIDEDTRLFTDMVVSLNLQKLVSVAEALSRDWGRGDAIRFTERKGRNLDPSSLRVQGPSAVNYCNGGSRDVLIYASNVINLLTIITSNHHLFNLILDCKSLLQQPGNPPVKHVKRETTRDNYRYLPRVSPALKLLPLGQLFTSKTQPLASHTMKLAALAASLLNSATAHSTNAAVAAAVKFALPLP